MALRIALDRHALLVEAAQRERHGLILNIFGWAIEIIQDEDDWRPQRG